MELDHMGSIFTTATASATGQYIQATVEKLDRPMRSTIQAEGYDAGASRAIISILLWPRTVVPKGNSAIST